MGYNNHYLADYYQQVLLQQYLSASLLLFYSTVEGKTKNSIDFTMDGQYPWNNGIKLNYPIR